MCIRDSSEPDIVMACCGDTPTLETLAAVTILREAIPEIKIRVINVVDLMKLEPATEHPHGLTAVSYTHLIFMCTHNKPPTCNYPYKHKIIFMYLYYRQLYSNVNCKYCVLYFLSKAFNSSFCSASIFLSFSIRTSLSSF